MTLYIRHVYLTGMSSVYTKKTIVHMNDRMLLSSVIMIQSDLVNPCCFTSSIIFYLQWLFPNPNISQSEHIFMRAGCSDKRGLTVHGWIVMKRLPYLPLVKAYIIVESNERNNVDYLL